jgi:hypothetical protein
MTTQAKHTKGPWHTGQGNGEGSIFCESGRMRLESGGTTLYPVCAISRGWDEGEDEANAHLIAAAPDLLEALSRLAVWADHLGPCFCQACDYLPGNRERHKHTAECDLARAAIAKAEGRAE